MATYALTVSTNALGLGVINGATVRIEKRRVRVLPTITATTDTFPVDDYFAPAIQEWMLYSIWCGDDEQSPNYGAAQGHLQTFFSLLQVKSNSDVASSPRAVKRG